MPTDDTDDDDELDTELQLPYGDAEMYGSWWAYKHHGILPYEGGYFDQPRMWQRGMHKLNTRYNRMVSQLLRTKKEGGDPLDRIFGKGKREPLEDLL